MFKSLVVVASASLVLGGCASHLHSLAEGKLVHSIAAAIFAALGIATLLGAGEQLGL